MGFLDDRKACESCGDWLNVIIAYSCWFRFVNHYNEVSCNLSTIAACASCRAGTDCLHVSSGLALIINYNLYLISE